MLAMLDHPISSLKQLRCAPYASAFIDLTSAFLQAQGTHGFGSVIIMIMIEDRWCA